MELKEIEKLSDKTLLELEHDTHVDLLGLLPGRDCNISEYLKISSHYRDIEFEVLKRGLEKLHRLNGFY